MSTDSLERTRQRARGPLSPPLARETLRPDTDLLVQRQCSPLSAHGRGDADRSGGGNVAGHVEEGRIAGASKLHGQEDTHFFWGGGVEADRGVPRQEGGSSDICQVPVEGEAPAYDDAVGDPRDNRRLENVRWAPIVDSLVCTCRAAHSAPGWYCVIVRVERSTAPPRLAARRSRTAG